MEKENSIGYFLWITGLANEWCSEYGSYHQLIEILHLTPFYSPIYNDKNRIKDAVNLRTQFDPSLSLDEPCSILELMIALAFRCEKDIMDDPDTGDRTGFWFFSMIKSLGLSEMTDEKFNLVVTMATLDNFVKRRYKPNGEGSLFTIHHSRQDFRNKEIWYQMCWYLDEYTSDAAN